jgi:hypothetical protein
MPSFIVFTLPPSLDGVALPASVPAVVIEAADEQAAIFKVAELRHFGMAEELHAFDLSAAQSFVVNHNVALEPKEA